MTQKQWYDSTGYAQGQRGTIEPTCWSLEISRNATLTVTKGHIYFPDEWITHFHPFYEKRRLNMPAKDFTKEEAQKAALDLAEKYASQVYVTIREAAKI